MCLCGFSSYFDMVKAALKNKNYQKAKEFHSKAESGMCGRKYYRLGLLYFKGDGVVQDRTRAFDYFLKAIKHGEIRAYHALGLIYQYGYERPQDIVRAKRCFEKGAEMGDFVVKIALERLLRSHSYRLRKAS
ncbi:tetratricopeptide repeat protein [Helicobacter heilmannii]|uniref:tetratricopeptide repeat protein n=1 Tax=Helicobacter heilmannii TaxID=35817 RepID=UPI000CF0D7C5|nr:tetratricopeptide repeat protein [Helicobacter heilmannii]